MIHALSVSSVCRDASDIYADFLMLNAAEPVHDINSVHSKRNHRCKLQA